MTQTAALYKFFSGFDIDAYPNTGVPDEPVLPYLTYEVQQSAFNEGEVYITVQIWYKSDSEAKPNAKAKEIADAIGRGGHVITCDDGAIWIKRGSPWCIASNAEGDVTIKLRQLNVTLEYLTT